MTEKPASKKKPEQKARTDNRRQFLTVMDPDVILQLKKAALDEGKPAYEIVEQAVQQYLKSRLR